VIKAFKSKQFISFLVVGGFSAIINFGSRFFYDNYTSFGNAVILAYITGMITAFTLSKIFVFKESVNSTKKEFFYFTLVNIVAVIQTYIISIGFAEYIFPKIMFNFYPHSVGHAIGVIFPVFTSFIGHKYFTFKGDK